MPRRTKSCSATRTRRSNGVEPSSRSPASRPSSASARKNAARALIFLSQEEYADARTKPNRFILARGHKFRTGTIRSSTDRFDLVEKDGLAKEIAEREAI